LLEPEKSEFVFPLEALKGSIAEAMGGGEGGKDRVGKGVYAFVGRRVWRIDRRGREGGVVFVD
jgi:hypothetical protein